jgi:glycosyltransferase involved in cell wall biosynthesis
MISIILITHNAEHTIIETLNSVAKQTYPDFECLVLDEFSTDNTVSLITNYCKTNDRFKFIMNCSDNNDLYCSSLNYAYKLAQGNYVFRINQHTILNENHIEILLKYMMDHPDVDVCCSNIKIPGVEYVKDECHLMFLRKYPILYFQESCNRPQKTFHIESSVISKKFLLKTNVHYLKYTSGFADDMFCRYACTLGAKFDKIDECTIEYISNDRSLNLGELTPVIQFYAVYLNYKGHSFYRNRSDEFYNDTRINITNLIEVYQNTIIGFINVLFERNELSLIEAEFIN